MAEADDGGVTGDSGLPESLALAWGLRERPAKGPKPGLSLDRIVSAAVDLAAAEGLGAVSMGRVARELGVSTMSLYRYVAAKDELYVLMQERAIGRPPEPPPPGTPWRERVARWTRAQREVAHRNLWTLRIPIQGPPLGPNNVAWMEQGLAALEGTGLTEDEKLGVLSLIGGFVRSEAVLMADLDAAMSARGIAPDESMRRYVRTLRALTAPDADNFPAVTRLLDSGAMEQSEDPETRTPDADFDFGLTTLLDGVEALVERRE
ncbi:TetR/AcrR family transcriptional regulator [Streptomyces apocyni]|uniref:TetR/AcrR family transcriptional regulator n=1 Tax=Streptomyces apocyni TaxID=2654677 RepID=UPI0012EA4979|nr:TetR/AcrR family transcriptional regulator [Streptomyces apocyni]